MKLTTPDLVVLALLCERPMHGYDAVGELERREVRDWAGISRPQVYYSLKKLEAARLIEPVTEVEPGLGPERRIFRPTSAARAAMASTLEDEAWATQRPPPPFVTWMVLSLHARKPAIKRQLMRRRAFLEANIDKERQTLRQIRAEEGPLQPIALAIVDLAIRQFELELRWLDEAARALGADG
jgi:DNA-binding PadR family transcriptional regulator